MFAAQEERDDRAACSIDRVILVLDQCFKRRKVTEDCSREEEAIVQPLYRINDKR